MRDKAACSGGARAEPDVPQTHQLAEGWRQELRTCGRTGSDADRVTPGSTGNGAYSGGPSADMVISQAVNPTGVDPMCLYLRQRGRTSPIGSRSGPRARARFERATRIPTFSIRSWSGSRRTTTHRRTTTTDPVEAELAATRKSINDVVHGELNSLMRQLGLERG